LTYSCGRRELSLPIYREPFLMQLYFAARFSNRRIISLLEQQLEAHDDQLRAYEALPPPPTGEGGANRALELARLTLERGLRSEQM